MAAPPEEYRLSARHYDATYALLRTPSGDVDFYRALAREAGGPVLELGCGTGRVLLPIARDGIPCTGLEASAEMLAILRGMTPPPNLALVRGRMEHFDLGGARFALVFSAFRAFQHLLDVDDQLACLACVRRHLAPRGRFAFDVFNPQLARIADDSDAETEDARFAADGVETVRFAARRQDRARQVMTLRLRYEHRRDGVIVGEEREEFRLRWFLRWELEHLLARAGFAVDALWGDFHRRPFAGDPPEIVIVARPAS
ncbi:MAG TPA: class I SAM-dependent methyltransferase [Candidatus Binatia bacterium]|nr:class I SAM-dependent methyltransferase [Candidatus Binatia bacterium]